MRDTVTGPHREESDTELTAFLHAVQGGCRASFARLYSATSPRLFAVVMSFSRNASEAEEVLQDIYVMVWTRCAQFDANKGKAIHWLGVIARQAATNSLRKRSCRAQTLPSDQRECVSMAFCGGLTQLEIADHPERPLGTVKASVRRALATMRSPLDVSG